MQLVLFAGHRDLPGRTIVRRRRSNSICSREVSGFRNASDAAMREGYSSEAARLFWEAESPAALTNSLVRKTTESPY